MNKWKLFSADDKLYFMIYLTLSLIVIFSLIGSFFSFNLRNIILSIFTLIVFNSLNYIENFFKIHLPSLIKIMILLFIFSSEILGQVYNFYGLSSIFDKFVHALNGFLCASLGLCLIFILNKSNAYNKEFIILKLFMAFCFSMTISVFWEFHEYGIETLFRLDMQRDQYVYNISSTFLDNDKKKKEVEINDIDSVVLYDSNNIELKRLDGYLDIGLNDTMQDLIGNAIGSILFCALGYLYVVDKSKYRVIRNIFITNKIPLA